MKKRKFDLSDVPMEILAFEALKEAVSEVIADHKRAREPLAIWRDGKVVKVPADQLELRETQAEYSKEKKSKKLNRLK